MNQINTNIDILKVFRQKPIKAITCSFNQALIQSKKTLMLINQNFSYEIVPLNEEKYFLNFNGETLRDFISFLNVALRQLIKDKLSSKQISDNNLKYAMDRYPLFSVFVTVPCANILISVDNYSLPFNYSILPIYFKDLKINNEIIERPIASQSAMKYRDLIHETYMELKNNTLMEQTAEVWPKGDARAPGIGGTACCAKTSKLTESINVITGQLDPNAKIIKISKFGTYRNKANDPVLLSQYIHNLEAVGKRNFTSVVDRCLGNQLFWSMIMVLLKPEIPVVDTCIKLFSGVGEVLIETLTRNPIIYIIDPNEKACLARMRQRGKGTDCLRSFVHNYVFMQNFVHAVFAKITKAYLITYKSNLFESIPELLLAQVKHNINLKKCLPTEPFTEFSFDLKYADNTYDSDYAKIIGIYK